MTQWSSSVPVASEMFAMFGADTWLAVLQNRRHKFMRRLNDPNIGLTGALGKQIVGLHGKAIEGLVLVRMVVMVTLLSILDLKIYIKIALFSPGMLFELKMLPCYCFFFSTVP